MERPKVVWVYPNQMDLSSDQEGSPHLVNTQNLIEMRFAPHYCQAVAHLIEDNTDYRFQNSEEEPAPVPECQFGIAYQ